MDEAPTTSFSIAASAITGSLTMRPNMDQQIVIIPEDRLKLILTNRLSAIAAKSSWQTPGGVALSLVLALTTATFRDAFGLTSAEWRAIFFVAAFGAVVFTTVRGLKALFSPKLGDLVDEILKNQSSTKPSGDLRVSK